MIRPMLRKLIPLAAAVLLVSVSATADAVLLKSYDFNGDLSDTLGNGVDLIASGGSIAGGRYSFLDNQGLRLNTALPSTTDYGIEIKLQMNTATGFSKLIDFQLLASDFGLYENDDAGLEFFDLTPIVGNTSLDTDFIVGLERSAGQINLFLNGTSLVVVADPDRKAVPGLNILNFFEDDLLPDQSESFRGSVDFIRIHDDASTFGTAPPSAPEPTTLALLGLALAGLGFARRRLH